MSILNGFLILFGGLGGFIEFQRALGGLEKLGGRSVREVDGDVVLRDEYPTRWIEGVVKGVGCANDDASEVIAGGEESC